MKIGKAFKKVPNARFCTLRSAIARVDAGAAPAYPMAQQTVLEAHTGLAISGVAAAWTLSEALHDQRSTVRSWNVSSTHYKRVTASHATRE